MGLKNLGAEKLQARTLDFIWILDVSGSMHGERIAALNYAIKDSLTAMKQAAADNINADIMIRVLTFSTNIKWHVNKRTLLMDFLKICLTFL